MSAEWTAEHREEFERAFHTAIRCGARGESAVDAALDRLCPRLKKVRLVVELTPNDPPADYWRTRMWEDVTLTKRGRLVDVIEVDE